MQEYKVTFLVIADSEENATQLVLDRLNAGGDPDEIEATENQDARP